ncbi:MAG: ABC transporter ATP-binding protein [Solirubrobacterales bacterium]
MSASSPALEARDLTVSFQRPGQEPVAALTDVDLTVTDGEFVVLLGPSGHGKSTLLNVIAGLLEPTAGAVYAHGNKVTGPDPERGMVFQVDSTFPWMRVRKHIGYGLPRRMPAEERRRIVERYLTAVGLDEFASSWPRELSGGMRKRLAIATAFAPDPRILLMDEPFGSLDFVTRAMLHQLLLDLWGQTGKTIVFVTHDVDEALLLADRIVVLGGGRIVEEIEMPFGRPRGDELRRDPTAIEIRRQLLLRLGLNAEVLT